MYESTKKHLISKSDDASKKEEPQFTNQKYSVEPDPEVIENDEVQSSKNSSDSLFLKEGTHIDIITQL